MSDRILRARNALLDGCHCGAPYCGGCAKLADALIVATIEACQRTLFVAEWNDDEGTRPRYTLHPIAAWAALNALKASP